MADAGRPISNLPCGPGFVTIAFAANDPGAYAGSVAAYLDELGPDGRYLATRPSCSYLARNHRVEDPLVYQAYLGPFASLEEACAARDQRWVVGNVDAYVSGIDGPLLQSCDDLFSTSAAGIGPDTVAAAASCRFTGSIDPYHFFQNGDVYVDVRRSIGEMADELASKQQSMPSCFVQATTECQLVELDEPRVTYLQRDQRVEGVWTTDPAATSRSGVHVGDSLRQVADLLGADTIHPAHRLTADDPVFTVDVFGENDNGVPHESRLRLFFVDGVVVMMKSALAANISVVPACTG